MLAFRVAPSFEPPGGERFLELVYEAAQGSPDRLMPGAPIGAALGLDAAEAAILAKQIADEGFLNWYIGNAVNLTSAGIVRVRASRGAQ
jgi:hypothetical protein